MKGILYVAATPIGNLKDITLRAIEVLQESDFLVAESRQRALNLLNHFNIKKPVLQISSYTEERKARAIVGQLQSGRQGVLITGAGTPCISDPGMILVKRCYDAGVEVRAVPGPSAALAALAISGLTVDRFIFYGFLPLKRGKKKKVLQHLLDLTYTIVLFESPRRVIDTLNIVHELSPDRLVAVAREMTKVYEEVLRGPIGEVIETLEGGDLKGEFTIIVEGQKSAPPANHALVSVEGKEEHEVDEDDRRPRRKVQKKGKKYPPQYGDDGTGSSNKHGSPETAGNLKGAYGRDDEKG